MFFIRLFLLHLGGGAVIIGLLYSFGGVIFQDPCHLAQVPSHLKKRSPLPNFMDWLWEENSFTAGGSVLRSWVQCCRAPSVLCSRSRSGRVVGGHDVSSAQATGVYHIDNCVVLGKHCKCSAVATKAVGVFHGTSRSTCSGPTQAALETQNSGVHIFSYRGQMQVAV